MMNIALALALCLLPLCVALPDGAPDAACDEMIPRHEVDPQPSNTLPFNIKCDLTDQDTIRFELKGNPQNQFRGILVQIRNNRNQRVGEFVNIPTGYQRSCNDEAVTHDNNADKRSVEFEVKITSEDASSLRCWFTVVQEKVVFWTAENEPVKIPASLEESVEGPINENNDKERKSRMSRKKENKKKLGKKGKKSAKRSSKKEKAANKRRKAQKKSKKAQRMQNRQ